MATGKKLWTPGTVEPPKMWRCRVCGETIPLTDRRSQEKHVVSCSSDHEVLLHEFSPRHRQDNFLAGHVDPEWAVYNEALKRAGINPEVQYNRGRKSNIKRARES